MKSSSARLRIFIKIKKIFILMDGNVYLDKRCMLIKTGVFVYQDETDALIKMNIPGSS